MAYAERGMTTKERHLLRCVQLGKHLREARDKKAVLQAMGTSLTWMYGWEAYLAKTEREGSLRGYDDRETWVRVGLAFLLETFPDFRLLLDAGIEYGLMQAGVRSFPLAAWGGSGIGDPSEDENNFGWTWVLTYTRAWSVWDRR